MDMCALKRRTRSAGAAEQTPTDRQRNLGIGANVERQHRLVGMQDVRRHQHCNVVSADKAGDVRWKVDQRTGGYGQAQFRDMHL